MPSDELALRFQDDLRLKQRWRWDGRHYQKTANAWLANLDRNKEAVMPILERTYGIEQAGVWCVRWRVFFMACAELFGYDQGQAVVGQSLPVRAPGAGEFTMNALMQFPAVPGRLVRLRARRRLRSRHSRRRHRAHDRGAARCCAPHNRGSSWRWRCWSASSAPSGTARSMLLGWLELLQWPAAAVPGAGLDRSRCGWCSPRR